MRCCLVVYRFVVVKKVRVALFEYYYNNVIFLFLLQAQGKFCAKMLIFLQRYVFFAKWLEIAKKNVTLQSKYL